MVTLDEKISKKAKKVRNGLVALAGSLLLLYSGSVKGQSIYENLQRVHNCDEPVKTLDGSETLGYYNQALNSLKNKSGILGLNMPQEIAENVSYECPKTSLEKYMKIDNSTIQAIKEGKNVYSLFMASFEDGTTTEVYLGKRINLEDVFVKGKIFLSIEITKPYNSRTAQILKDKKYIVRAEDPFGFLDAEGFSELGEVTIYNGVGIVNNLDDKNGDGLYSLNEGEFELSNSQIHFTIDKLTFKPLESVEIKGNKYKTGEIIPKVLYSSNSSEDCSEVEIINPISNNGIISEIKDREQIDYEEFYDVCNEIPKCEYNGEKYSDGKAITVYEQPIAPVGLECSSIKHTAVCKNGNWTIDDIIESLSEYSLSCTPASCKDGDQTYESGYSFTGYEKDLVFSPDSCEEVTTTCELGKWTNGLPSSLYDHCYVSVINDWDDSGGSSGGDNSGSSSGSGGI